MSRKSKLIAAVVALSAAFSVAACARHHHSRSPERANKLVTHKVDRALSRVDATDAQRAKIHQVKDRVFAEFLTAYEGSAQTKQTMLSEWKSETPDAEKLHKLADLRVAAYQMAIHEAVDGLIEVHATLEKDQRDEITGQIEKRMGK